MDTAIEVRNLVKTFAGDVRAVKDISFGVQRGEVFGLLGPNGAGKSTTVGMLTTTVRPSSGTAELGGFDVVARRSGAFDLECRLPGTHGRPRADGAANLDIRPPVAGRRPTPGRVADSPRRSASPTCSTVPSARTAEASGGASRSPRRVAPPSSSSTSRRSAWTASGRSCSDIIAGLRDRMETTILLTTHYLDEGRAALRPAGDHARAGSSPSTPRALRGRLGERIVELRVPRRPTGRALGRLRDDGLAGPDAFAVGATITIPLHDRDDSGAIA